MSNQQCVEVVSECNARVKELEQTIRQLKADISSIKFEHVSGSVSASTKPPKSPELETHPALLRNKTRLDFEIVSAPDHDSLSNGDDLELLESRPLRYYDRNRRQGVETLEQSTLNRVCVAYPDYVDSGQCIIWRWTNASSWDECPGNCRLRITATCEPSRLLPREISPQQCIENSLCIDCSDVSATSPPLDQVPCPPQGYTGDQTEYVTLILDNNHNLNLTGAFGKESPYERYIGDLSLANTTLNGSQFTFEFMHIAGNVNMSTANISGGFRQKSFYDAHIQGTFDMRYTTVSGGFKQFTFANMNIGGNFDMGYATIVAIGGFEQHAFSNMNIDGHLNMSFVTIVGTISNFSFFSASISGDMDMSFANLYRSSIDRTAFVAVGVFGNVLFVKATFPAAGIPARTFEYATVAGFVNASGARFPHNTLPIQLFYGFEVQQGIELSHCNLNTLEEHACSDNGCLRGQEGGPFTGMAMPVGIASTVVDLSYNNLRAIRNTSLLGITATILDLSHNQIAEFHPYWFLGIPNARKIDTIGNPSICKFMSTKDAGYTLQELDTIQCHCNHSLGMYGTGNFCSNSSCRGSLDNLNAFIAAATPVGHGGYVVQRQNNDHPSIMPSGDNATFWCPEGKHAHNASSAAMTAQCLGGGIERLQNECDEDAKPSWLTPGRIVGIVFGVLVIAAILGYFVLLSPEKRKRQHLASELDITTNEVELNERLLHKTNCDLEEATALNTRMRGAWKIEESDVVIGSELASGSFGVVYDGKFGGIRVAVKVLKHPLNEENYPNVGKDFTRECETLMAIRHTCLLIFYGAGLNCQNRPFMVTEFMSKGSLKTVLADKTQTLLWPLRSKFAHQIAKGMEYLHGNNIIHRDLKSDNCLVNDDLDAKVCDFGTSKFITAGRSTLQQPTFDFALVKKDSLAVTATMTSGVGTILWMAPELFMRGTKYKQEIDMYSFGIIMWELATREVPWDEIKEPQYIRFYQQLRSAMKNDRRPHIPDEVINSQPDFVSLMKKCWASVPDSRPTFKHVVQMLARKCEACTNHGHDGDVNSISSDTDEPAM